jgi:hypothetical protein
LAANLGFGGNVRRRTHPPTPLLLGREEDWKEIVGCSCFPTLSKRGGEGVSLPRRIPDGAPRRGCTLGGHERGAWNLELPWPVSLSSPKERLPRLPNTLLAGASYLLAVLRVQLSFGTLGVRLTAGFHLPPARTVSSLFEISGNVSEHPQNSENRNADQQRPNGFVH